MLGTRLARSLFQHASAYVSRWIQLVLKALREGKCPASGRAWAFSHTGRRSPERRARPKVVMGVRARSTAGLFALTSAVAVALSSPCSSQARDRRSALLVSSAPLAWSPWSAWLEARRRYYVYAESQPNNLLLPNNPFRTSEHSSGTFGLCDSRVDVTLSVE